METVKLATENDFQDTITNGVVLVDFNAPWCAPCRFQEPIVKDLARQFEGQALVSAFNVEENRDTAIRLGIHSIPTLILFKNGLEIQLRDSMKIFMNWSVSLSGRSTRLKKKPAKCWWYAGGSFAMSTPIIPPASCKKSLRNRVWV
jgi:thioredoxin 1